MIFDGCTSDQLKQQIGEAAFPRLIEFARRKEALGELFMRRDADCKLLPYPCYEEYRRSSLWKRLRRAALKRDNKVCRRCGGKANQVHHRSYSLEVLRGEVPEQLVSICKGCHHHIHYDEHGADRFQEEWDSVLISEGD
jgi:hypothetical protein